MTSPVRKFLFGSMVRLVTPLDQARCVAALNDVTNTSWIGFLSSRPMRGSVNEREFHWRKPVFFSNSFQTHLVGMLSPESSGTNITCRFGLSVSARIFLAVFLVWGIGAPLLEFLSPGTVSISLDDTEVLDELYRRLVTLAFLPFTMVIFLFGRFLARKEQGFMLSLLKETLQAKEVAAAEPKPAPGRTMAARRPASVIER
jgi:hypothetical protein